MENTIEMLDPRKLYTSEVTVHKDKVDNVNINDPIQFGRDINGIPYITNGNHRAAKAFRENKLLPGRQISTGNFDVTEDEYFHPISELKIIK